MRLIDADALIEALSSEPKYSIEMPISMGDAIQKLIATHQGMIVEVVKKQPTAYDIDKVVEETIRDKAVKWNNNSSKRVPYEFIDYVEGKREIGVADDVCEWKIDGVYLHSPHNRPFVTCIADDEDYRYNFCPVCGKKIKVVE